MPYYIISDNGLFVTEFIGMAIFEHLKEDGTLPIDAPIANWDTKKAAEKYLDGWSNKETCRVVFIGDLNAKFEV